MAAALNAGISTLIFMVSVCPSGVESFKPNMHAVVRPQLGDSDYYVAWLIR